MQAPSIPWEVFAFVLSTSGVLYSWFTNRQSVMDRRVAKLETLLSTLTERVSHLPTTRDLTELIRALERNTGEVAALAGKVDAAIHRVDLHEEWLTQESAR